MTTTPTNATGLEVVGNHAYLYNRNGTYAADTALARSVEEHLNMDTDDARRIGIVWAESLGYSVSEKFTTPARGGQFAAVTYTGSDPEPHGVDGATADEQAGAAAGRVPTATYVARALKRDAGIRSTPADGRRGYHVRGGGRGVAPVIDVDVSDAPRANNRAADELEEALADLGWTVNRPNGGDLIYVTRVPNNAAAERRRINAVAAQRRAAAIAGNVTP